MEDFLDALMIFIAIGFIFLYGMVLGSELQEAEEPNRQDEAYERIEENLDEINEDLEVIREIEDEA